MFVAELPLLPPPGTAPGSLLPSPLGVRKVPAAQSASRGAMVELSICGSWGVTMMPESFCASPV